MNHAFTSFLGRSCAVLSLVALASFSTGTAHADDAISLFNGKDLTGWKGLDFWSVKDGAIVGQTTAEHPTAGNTFLVLQDKVLGDFEFTCQYRITSQNEKGFGNSGIQYRSTLLDPEKFILGGYQADFEFGTVYSGILYEEKMRGILAKRGEKVVVKQSDNPKKPTLEVVGSLGTTEELQAVVKQGEWNEYKIIAKGNHLQHFINGHQTIDVVDETAEGAKTGVLGLQLHAGGPMTVEFKDLLLKELK